MTTMTKNPGANTATIPQRTGFQPIPTRIRDVREAQIPPLVIEPIADPSKALVQESLAELGSKLAEIHRIAAEAYLSQGSYEQALPHLESAATFAPDATDCRLQLGFVRYVVGDDVGAVDAYNAVLTKEPTNGEAWYSLGMIMFGQNQFAAAEDCFRRAAEVLSQDAQVWNNRGVCLWQMSRITEARGCFERALAIDPQDADARHNLASIRD